MTGDRNLDNAIELIREELARRKQEQPSTVEPTLEGIAAALERIERKLDERPVVVPCPVPVYPYPQPLQPWGTRRPNPNR
jgi:hypothetical protein